MRHICLFSSLLNDDTIAWMFGFCRGNRKKNEKRSWKSTEQKIPYIKQKICLIKNVFLPLRSTVEIQSSRSVLRELHFCFSQGSKSVDICQDVRLGEGLWAHAEKLLTRRPRYAKPELLQSTSPHRTTSDSLSVHRDKVGADRRGKKCRCRVTGMLKSLCRALA